MYRHYYLVHNFCYSLNVMYKRTTYFLYKYEIKISHRMKFSGNAEIYEYIGLVFNVVQKN